MKTLGRYLLFAGLVSCSFPSPLPAKTLTSGQIGSRSQASIRITAIAPARMQVVGSRSIGLAGLKGRDAAARPQRLCVWANTSSPRYSVTALSGAPSGDFSLVTAAGDRLPFTVEWADRAGASSGTRLEAGSPLTGLSATAGAGCSGREAANASLIVKAAGRQKPAEPEAYTGTIMLVLAPE